MNELAQEVINRVGTPRDAFELTAQLEVMGLRDTDARAGFGEKDLFTLGQTIFRGITEIPIEPDDPPKPYTPLRDFAKHYIDGSIFAVPTLLQAAAILAWGYGLWGALDVDVRTGTAIALGFIASYVLTGGFVQAITRRGLFYKFQQEPGLARWVVLRGWWIAVRVVLGLLVPALLFNALYRLLPWDLFFIAALYYAALSLLWLNWSMIYIAARRYWVTLVTAVALIVVIATARGLGWNVIPANIAGLLVASAVSFVVWNLGESRAPVVHNPPRLTVLVFATSRWFLYGLLYNTFVFADRIVAWTARTGREDFPPYSFWLSARYELGMDLALVVVILLAGAVEAAVQTFSDQLVPIQKSIRVKRDLECGGHAAALVSGTKSGGMAAALQIFSDWFRSFHRRRFVALTIAAIVAVAIARACVALVARLPNADIAQAMSSRSAMTAFWLGAAGYALLILALQNALLLMTLSRVELVVRDVAIALATNLAVGFVCSRAIHYAGAAAGLVAGSLVLLILTWRDVNRVATRLDYHYFAAF